MRISRLCVHSILSFLQRYTLGHMLGPSARPPKLFWHSCPPSALHWIMSPGARYSTAPMMGDCWLGVRLPMPWLSHMRSASLGFVVLGVLLSPTIGLCWFLEYQGATSGAFMF